MQTNIEYKKRKLTLKAQIPLSWHHVYLRDTDLEKEQQLTRILFDPSLSANYKISNFWRIRALWKMSNRLGDIDRIHYGFILQNYRSLSQNAAALSETSHQSFSSHISYRNPITSFFNSLGYIYAIRSNNLMYSSIIQSDGTTILQTIEQPNTSYVHSLQAETSKFFSLTKTSLSLNFNFNQRMGKSLMNGEAFDTKNIFFTLKPRLNISISTWLNSEYELQADYINTFIESQRKSAIRMIRHRLNFFAFPARNQLISLSSEYYDYEGSDNLFVDLKYRYSIVAKKIDLEVRWNNIFNNKTYTTLQASSFTVYQSTYLLRPSQVLLLVKFSF
jgi:hypothetical protein